MRWHQMRMRNMKTKFYAYTNKFSLDAQHLEAQTKVRDLHRYLHRIYLLQKLVKNKFTELEKSAISLERNSMFLLIPAIQFQEKKKKTDCVKLPALQHLHGGNEAYI